jgi:hypothetical protein
LTGMYIAIHQHFSVPGALFVQTCLCCEILFQPVSGGNPSFRPCHMHILHSKNARK